MRPRREGTSEANEARGCRQKNAARDGEADKKTRRENTSQSVNPVEMTRRAGFQLPPLGSGRMPFYSSAVFPFLSSRLGASSNSFLSVIGLRGLPVPWIPTEWWRGKVQMAHGFLLTQSGGSQLTCCCSGSGRDGTEEGMNG